MKQPDGMLGRLPVPRPDFSNLRQVLLRQGEPARLPNVEFFMDHPIKEGLLGERVPHVVWGDPGYSHEAHARYLDFDIRFWYLAGYDYVTVELQVPMMRQWLTAGDTALLASAERRWQSENSGAIQSWSDFERYPWPKPEDVDFFNLEYVSRHLPEGMQIIFCTQGGPMENLVTLMGLTPLALAVHDAPDLVAAIAERLSEVRETIYAAAVDVPNVGAFWMGDDLGYKTSTVLSPRDLRKYVFPYQKRIVDIAHAHDKPFLLHACGNLARIMDELIDGVGIDAKHSFEDVIMPVAEFKQRWGSRVAVLGGIDMDFLCRHSVQEVRTYTRKVIEACAPGGGYALGTGNTPANYVPLENYLAMLDEGARYAR